MATKPASGVIPGIISAPASKASAPSPKSNGSPIGGSGVINPYVSAPAKGKK